MYDTGGLRGGGAARSRCCFFCYPFISFIPVYACFCGGFLLSPERDGYGSLPFVLHRVGILFQNENGCVGEPM